MSKYLHDMRAGDDYNVLLTVNDVDGVAVDITGYKFWLTLKSSFDLTDLEAELQFSTIAGTNPNDDVLNGICVLSVPASATKTVPQGKYFYDIQQQVGSSMTTVLPPVADYNDRITVVPEVTRSV